MSTAGQISFGTYCLVGPIAWLIVAYLVRVGRSRMSKLSRSRDQLPNPMPLVSILVPAKDEGERIRDCLGRVLDQIYPPIEVIAINDRSTDDTGRVLEEFTQPIVLAQKPPPDDAFYDRMSPARVASAPVVRVVHIDELPAGWLGKCHALTRGAEFARGEWLLFVDSDVRLLHQDTLSRLISAAVAREYDALSILTKIETHTFVEKLMLPLLASTWMTTFAGDQTNEDSETDKALANGQVFLIRAEAYRKVGGHAAVKDRIVEDVELMRLLKKSGYKCRLMSGADLAATRMHTNLQQMFNGWARIFAGTARGRVWPMVAAIAFLLLCVVSIVPAVAMFRSEQGLFWLAAVTVHAMLINHVAGNVWSWSGNNSLFALLLPISIPIEIAILIYSIRKAISGKIDWRGSAVDVRQTSRAVDRSA